MVHKIKQVSVSTTRLLAKSSDPLPNEKPQTEKLSQPLMDKLALKMSEIYGHRWTSSFGVLFNQDHAWASALSGITGQQLATGLMAVIASGEKWPPSAPEFRALCEARPTAESLGMPKLEKAFAEACQNSHPAAQNVAAWSHQCVYHAAVETGFYVLANLTTPKKIDEGRKLFARNYEITVRDFVNGKPLKAIPLALTHGVEARVTPEAGRAGISALRAAMKAPRLTELPERMAHLGGGL